MVLDSLQFMVHGEDLIWLCFYLLMQLLIINPFLFNNGNLSRDFTYIEDIVNGVTSTLLNDSIDKSLCKLYNIGNSSPVKLMDFINFN